MLTVSPLAQETIDQYNNEGWCLLGRVMDDDTIGRLREEEAKFRNRPLHYDDPNPAPPTLFRSQMTAYSAPVRDFGLHGAHLPLLQQIPGPDLAWIYTQFVTKFPDANLGKSGFPWHQDNGYAKVLPENNMTLWIPLDDVDLYNGCVWVVPGSHRGGILPHGQKSADSWHLEVAVEGDGVPAILKAGEAVAFTGLTLHRSKLNHSDKPRRTFFMQYVDANETIGNDDLPVVDKPITPAVHGVSQSE